MRAEGRQVEVVLDPPQPGVEVRDQDAMAHDCGVVSGDLLSEGGDVLPDGHEFLPHRGELAPGVVAITLGLRLHLRLSALDLVHSIYTIDPMSAPFPLIHLSHLVSPLLPENTVAQ